MKRAEKKAGSSTGVGHANGACLRGAAEPRFEKSYGAAGRGVVALGVERHDERRLRLRVHEDDEVLGDDAARERDEVLGEGAKDRQRLGDVGVGERADEPRKLDRPAHRLDEERLLRGEVAEDRRGGHVQLAGDVGERGSVVPARAEDAPRDLEQLFAGDRRWPAHL